MTMNAAEADDLAIALSDVWVQYKVRSAHHYNLKRSLVNAITRRKEAPETITALENVNLRIPEGTRLGIVGPNGSGKSTLLAVMSGALRPSRGSVTVHGRVLALLGGPDEGLDPEQTGRENALGLGVRLGESADGMRERIDDIHDFSGLGNRFDHPLYTYSSGMQIRLRFSTITSLKPDVLLIDEGIGMADSDFNQRASQRLAAFLSNSGTLIMASHSEAVIAEHCDQRLAVDKGRAVAHKS
jgi:ABC-type polysaccharide/polyol phosphate transport system ATPase subunit